MSTRYLMLSGMKQMEDFPFSNGSAMVGKLNQSTRLFARIFR